LALHSRGLKLTKNWWAAIWARLFICPNVLSLLSKIVWIVNKKEMMTEFSRNNLARNALRLSVLFSVLVAPFAAEAHGASRQKVEESIEIKADSDHVWKAVGDFQDMGWLPDVASTKEGDKPAFAHRKLILKNGGEISESLYKYDADNTSYSYRIDRVDPKVFPVTNYSATIIVQPVDNQTTKVEWRGAFYRGDPNETPSPELNDEASIAAVKALYKRGLENLKQKVEATH